MFSVFCSIPIPEAVKHQSHIKTTHTSAYIEIDACFSDSGSPALQQTLQAEGHSPLRRKAPVVLQATVPVCLRRLRAAAKPSIPTPSPPPGWSWAGASPSAGAPRCCCCRWLHAPLLRRGRGGSCTAPRAPSPHAARARPGPLGRWLGGPRLRPPCCHGSAAPGTAPTPLQR